jgi:hypothetical protein
MSSIEGVSLQRGHVSFGTQELTSSFLLIYILGLFVAKFLAAVDSINFVEVPLVFVTFALSHLPAASLLGPSALASIRYSVFAITWPGLHNYSAVVGV